MKHCRRFWGFDSIKNDQSGRLLVLHWLWPPHYNQVASLWACRVKARVLRLLLSVLSKILSIKKCSQISCLEKSSTDQMISIHDTRWFKSVLFLQRKRMLTSWSSPKYWNLIDLGYVQTVTTQPSIGLICMNTSKASMYRLDTIVNIAKSLFQVAMPWGVICTNITGSDLSFALNRGKVAPKITILRQSWILDKCNAYCTWSK